MKAVRRLDLKEVEDSGRRASKEAAMTAQKGGEAGTVWKEGVPVMRLAEGLLIHQGRVYSDCLG